MQLAWLWVRHQPQSVLTQWFEERVRRNGGRLRKTTIVAPARKLLVALWKYEICDRWCRYRRRRDEAPR
jgi:transposase